LNASGAHAILFERSRFDHCDCAWACTLRNRHANQHVPLLTFTVPVIENKVLRSLNTTGPSGLGVRVKEFLRHFNSSKATRLQLQDITLDAVGDRVTRRGRSIHLSPIQFRLLAYFMRNPHQVLTQQQLLVNVWGRSADPGRTVAMCVAGLRKALGDRKTNSLIRTVRGRGYALSFDREASPPNESAPRTIDGRLPRVRPRPRRRKTFGQRELRPKERSLLELLLLNPGITFTRECIADFIWGAGNVDVRTVDATVSRIRQVFLQRSLPNPIRGVIGRGYQINGYGPNEQPGKVLANRASRRRDSGAVSYA